MATVISSITDIYGEYILNKAIEKSFDKSQLHNA